MLKFDSPVVVELLQAQGWTPQREVTIPAPVQSALCRQPSLTSHPAVAALQNLAGLHIGQVGKGRECASSDIEFDWLEAYFTGEDADDALLCWEQRLHTRLIAVAEVHHAHGQLLMAGDGRCFSWSFVGMSFEGENIQQALEHLLLGIRSRPMLELGKSSTQLYGTLYKAGDPEIYPC
ncbi:hypothetical protein F3J24_11855 [Comamonas sp. Tr-654]|uniref:SUKH-3 domain-containing protein n=1 Tax=Comamonas sp. Tr-654 TaxID=2608341 RepID=UPI00142258EC|nr:SUKH-3 domain-containing protein [Comamonas sp. Tr-654]NIF84191.1 hypothetical protein [Comamonas sp. Tr-654]